MNTLEINFKELVNDIKILKKELKDYKEEMNETITGLRKEIKIRTKKPKIKGITIK